jgi:DNA invertase Pin-like site-specific DNA recombinase
MIDKLTPAHLQRRATIYVRQSTPAQLLLNRESRIRQYKLADYAQELGFTDVETIDDDLGRSGSGLVERPGFQRLVTGVCAGNVGAVFCLEASRLARNGRDWHHLIDLCGLVGTLLIDLEGIYDPRLSNDRLLLGLRGSMSEFELNVLRQRSLGAIRQKAQRGDLRVRLPVGFYWTEKIELDPDLRVQNAIGLVFRKFEELGSARQVLLWCWEEHITLPTIGYKANQKVQWIKPLKHAVLSILKNPCYAGAYAFGRTESRTSVLEGRAHKTQGHKKPRSEWMVLIRDHHPGYISWEQYERNQKLLAGNAHMNSRMSVQSGRGGTSLLAGKLRCRRCGHMLRVFYVGGYRKLRYQCLNETTQCISFGGRRPEQAVSAAILEVVQPHAIDAALKAVEQIHQKRTDRLQALTMELEQARYEARLAARRYEAIDPENRLVASELEARWNTSLSRVRQLEQNLQKAEVESPAIPAIGPDELLRLAQDLPVIWDAPSTDSTIKQRIVGILVQEIVVDVDEATNEVLLFIHWAGGRHSELRVAKHKRGQNSRCTPLEAVDVVRQMAAQYADGEIALTLNRLRLKTGTGNTWNETRVRSLRSQLKIVHQSSQQNDSSSSVNLEAAAKRLRVSGTVVRRLIKLKILPAVQVVAGAPWQIAVNDADCPAVVQAALRLQRREGLPEAYQHEIAPRLPGFEEGYDASTF